MWCIAEITNDYKTKMLDVLKTYEKSYNPLYPVICFDEKPKQLLGPKKQSIPAMPGKPKRVDYQYVRNGTCNIFLTVEPKGKFRSVRATKRRTASDFAREIRRITKLSKYRDAKKIHIVLDNLNTHFEKSFFKTFPKTEAEDILKRTKFHYTPKHGSWLNAAEIEINVLEKQCLNQYILTRKNMQKQITTWARDRNKQGAGIRWQFTRDKAEKKFNLT